MKNNTFCLLLVMCMLAGTYAVLSFDEAEEAALRAVLLRVSEATSTSTILGQLTCTDSVDGFAGVNMSVKGDNNLIVGKPQTGPRQFFTLTRKLDFENVGDQNEREILIQCEKANRITKNFQASLFIQDVNDNRPFFEREGSENQTYTVAINEILDVPPEGLEIFDGITVRDIDGVNNNIVDVKCEGLTSTPVVSSGLVCEEYFRLESTENTTDTRLGRTYNVKLFAMKSDYAAFTFFRLRMYAENVPTGENTTEPTLNSTVQNVQIIINEVQNEPPQIIQNTLRLEMFENLPAGSPVQSGHKIIAFDQDIRSPNPIEFELQPAPQDPTGINYFELGPSIKAPDSNNYEVELLLKQEIDREQIEDISKNVYVNIVAYETNPNNLPERNPMNKTETITVIVKDVNDEIPTFSNTFYEVSAFERSDFDVGRTQLNPSSGFISVTDNDGEGFNSFNVSVLPGPFSNLFELDPVSSSVEQIFTLYINNSALDFEQGPTTMDITLGVLDTDKPEFTSTALVRLTILPRNEFSPVFEQDSYTFFVFENLPIGTIIGRVNATDADRGAFGEIAGYSIQDNTGTFGINNDGEIFTLKVLDYELVDSYVFSVIARDNDTPQDAKEDTAQVTCIVDNLIDTPPRFLDDYETQVNEESVNLQPQITVQVENVEPNTLVTYSLEEVVPPGISLDEFFLIQQDGTFILKKPLDHRDTDNGLLEVLVRATNFPGIYAETFISITVQNLNNFAPVFVPSRPDNTYVVSISEAADAGFVVIDLNTTDLDEANTPSSEVEYDIKTGANNVFTIDQNSGIITVVGGMDIDVVSSYTVVVVARDKGNPIKSSSATVSIDLLDANNKNPVFEEVYSFQVNDSLSVGEFVGQVNASDPDTTANVTYALDRLSGRFELTGNTVAGDVSAVFTIEPTTGIIRLASRFSNTYNRASFDVIATDNAAEGSVQTARANVVIFILTTPDSRIVFDRPWTYDSPVIADSFSESVTTETTIFTLKATDPVKAEPISIFRKIPSSDVGDYFIVTGGNIQLRQAVDYEALPFTENGQKILTFEVEAISNDNERTGTATMRLQVTDFNDNAPEFERREYVVQLNENSEFPTEVARLRVTDKDSSSFGIVEFSLDGLDGTQNNFEVIDDPNEDNVAIIRVALNANLDYESNKTINLFVTAQDDRGSASGLSDTVTLRVDLTDVNDNPPIFRQKEYRFEVVAAASIGDVVGRVVADDQDTGINGEIVYDIVTNSPGASYFDAGKDPTTDANSGLQIGEITVARSLENLPFGTVFNITVIARDRGRLTRLSGTTIAIIAVSSEGQDPKPQWDDGLPTRVEIPENEPVGTFVAFITANASSSVGYSFITTGEETGDSNKFTINPATGEIRTKEVLDYEEQKFLAADDSLDAFFSLRILATVTLNDTLTNQYLLLVDVLDVDDNDPTFQNCTDRTYPIPVITNVMEARPPQELVYTVVGCDDDEPPNNIITYRTYIPDPASDFTVLCPNQEELFRDVFELDTITGAIRTRISLDRDTIPEYMLCIQAMKGNTERRKRGVADVDLARSLHDVLFLKVIVLDANDNGPEFTEEIVKTVILPNFLGDVSTAEATDIDIFPNNRIGYSISSIEYGRISQPHTFVISRTDGTISTSISDYSSFAGGSFDITVKAEDFERQNNFSDTQLHKVYVAALNDVIRVVIDKPADSGVEAEVNEMIGRLNSLQDGVFYDVTKISYHVINNEEDPLFDRTDVCLVVVQDEEIFNSQRAIKFLEEQANVNSILREYGATDPGTCDPAKSVYPQGWESYWWVLVAFAIFVFVCVLILIFIILSLYSSYKRYMDTRRTYLVPGN